MRCASFVNELKYDPVSIKHCFIFLCDLTAVSNTESNADLNNSFSDMMNNDGFRVWKCAAGLLYGLM